MRKTIALSIGLAFVLSLPGLIWSQDDNDELGERYILLATRQTKTMQKEMDAVAEMGFRVLMGSPTSGTEIVILMEKLASPEKPFEYQLLATYKTGTMEKELNAVGDAGFRLIPQTMMSKSGILSPDEIVVIMEKDPDSSARYEYRLLATERTSTMDKEITYAEEAGFELVAICSRGEHMVIMERESK